MIVYRDTIPGDDGVDMQKHNLDIPSALLSDAKDADVPFVMISRSSVFDMSLHRHYGERSRRNGKSMAGKILSVMEDYVLEYDKGIVIRVDCLFSEIFNDIRKMVGNDEKIPFDIMYPVTENVISHILKLVSEHELENDNRIVHVPVMEESAALMVFKMSNGGVVEVVDGKMNNAVMVSNNFDNQFGSIEKVSCEYANRYYISLAVEEVRNAHSS